MWPWAHAAVGYILLWAYVRLRAWSRTGARGRWRSLLGVLERAQDSEEAPVRERSPDGGTSLLGRGDALAVLVGSQVPDLVDKPLAWSFAILPSGRSLGHSLLLAVPVVAAGIVIARRRGRPMLGVALGLGYLTGVLTDVPTEVLSGDFSRATFLLWPLLQAPVNEQELSFAAHFAAIELSGEFLFQAALGLGVAIFAVREYRRIGPDA